MPENISSPEHATPGQSLVGRLVRPFLHKPKEYVVQAEITKEQLLELVNRIPEPLREQLEYLTTEFIPKPARLDTPLVIREITAKLWHYSNAIDPCVTFKVQQIQPMKNHEPVVRVALQKRKRGTQK